MQIGTQIAGIALPAPTVTNALPSTASGVSGGMDAVQRAKLVDGAQQFEGMMLAQMLKPLQFGEAAGADESEGGANDTIRSMGVEALSKAIAQAGGVGIAKSVIRQVTAEHEAQSKKTGQY